MKRRNFWMVLLGLVSMTGCMSTRALQESSHDLVRRSLPAPLVPQPEGTPLPARDLGIAERWPLEIKRLIDTMLALYPRTPGARPPSVSEIEQKMAITLTERPLTYVESIFYVKQFRIGGTRYANPLREQRLAGESFSIMRNQTLGGTNQSLRLIVAPQQSGFCLDPYELAVYTGSTFENGDTTPHAKIRRWHPSYVWGMFDWSRSNSYVGNGFSIEIAPSPESDGMSSSTHCVAAMTVFSPHYPDRIE